MLLNKSAQFLTLLFVLVGLNAHAKCDFADQQEPIKTYCEAFKKSERLIRGEKVMVQKNKGAELIYRTKTKSWQGFDWDLRPLEFFAVLASQEKFLERCESKQNNMMNSITEDIKKYNISMTDRKKALSALLFLSPCLETHQSQKLQELSTEQFQTNTEEFLNILIGIESDVSRYSADYKACTDAPVKNLAITDFVIEGIQKSLSKAAMSKSLSLRLKRLRTTKMQYKTAQYFFGKIDNLLINSAEK